MEDLLVFVPKKTNRIRFVFRLVFKDLLKVKCTLTSNLDEFLSADVAKLVYADKAYSDDILLNLQGCSFRKVLKTLMLKT